MKVNGGSGGPIRPDAAQGTRSTAAEGAGRQKQPAAPAQPGRSDSVEISDAGRAKSVTGANAERLQEIRARVLQGAYDGDAVVAEVARRILDRGDV